MWQVCIFSCVSARDSTAFVHQESRHILGCCWGVILLPLYIMRAYSGAAGDWLLTSLYIMRAATYSGAAGDYTASSWELPHTQVLLGTLLPLYIMRAATYSDAWVTIHLYIMRAATYSGAAGESAAFIHHESCHILRCCWGLCCLYTSWELPHTQVLLGTIQPLYIMRAATYSGAAGESAAFIHHESCHILRCLRTVTSWELPHTQGLYSLYILELAMWYERFLMLTFVGLKMSDSALLVCVCMWCVCFLVHASCLRTNSVIN